MSYTYKYIKNIFNITVNNLITINKKKKIDNNKDI